MTGMQATGLADCMSCRAKRVRCVWVMEPLFWRHCLDCHEWWELRA